MRNIVVLILMALCISCGNDPVPKPKAFLRLDYPDHKYEIFQPKLPFTFEKNELASIVSDLKVSRDGKTKGVDITYPQIKGTIYLTYKKVENNLESYLIDAQNLTQKHSQRADEITEQTFIDDANKVYGMFYEVGGNAASQSQFYVTDSLNHFITGSLYFYAKPNYDSILPAAHYLKRDIQHIMETIRWNN